MDTNDENVVVVVDSGVVERRVGNVQCAPRH